MLKIVFLWSRHAFKTTLAVLILYFITRIFKATPIEQCWALLTVFVVMDPRLGATVGAAKNRFMGTLIGILLAGIVLFLLPLNQLWSVIISLIIISIVGAKLLEWKSGLRTAGVTAILVYIISITDPNPWNISVDRSIYIVIGMLIPFIISLTIFPVRTSDYLAKELAALFSQASMLLQILLKNYLDKQAPSAGTIKSLQVMRTHSRANVALLEEMKMENWHRSSDWEKYSLLQEKQVRIYLCLFTLAEIAKKQNRVEMSPVLLEKMTRLVTCISDVCKGIAEHLLGNPALPSNALLIQASETIDSEFSNARRLSLFSSYSNDTILSLYALLFELKTITTVLQKALDEESDEDNNLSISDYSTQS